jgi:Zinc carboxypeptidase
MIRSAFTERSQPTPSALRWTMFAAIALLAGCGTAVPLPPWTPGGPARPAANTPPAAPSMAPPTDVQTFPVPARGANSGAADEPLPYGPAVAARFPAPAVTYSTPGLQSGRNTFTSQAEMHAWLVDQAAAAARNTGVKSALVPIGSSQNRQPLEALVLTRAGATDPGSLLASGKPTALLIGQQHGDEPAGSEALLVLARELSQGSLRPLLDRINVIIVPRGNPDGAATGQRLTQGGLDMNRDHLLLATPEAQALAKLTRDYKPTVVVDAHEYTAVGRFLQKFGALQRFDALVQYATTANTPEFLTRAAEEWYRRPLLASLQAQGLSSEWYYTTSTDLADKKISMGGVQPDTGRNIYGLKNSVSLLVETRGVGLGRLHIQRRVHTHVTAISSVLASTAQRASELGQLRPYIDREISARACREEAVVEAAATPGRYDLTMLDPESGVDKIVPVDWDSSLTLKKIKSRIRPCGYWLAGAASTAVERLRMHGVQVKRISEAGSVLGDSYREVSRTTGERLDVRGTIAAAAPVINAQVSLVRGVYDVPRNSYYITLNQPLGNLVLAALEPDTQNSYFANSVLPDLQSTVRVMTEPTVKMEALP